MQGVSTEKVAGGKLLRVKVDFDSKINKVQITGDFFAHPEDVIEKIENSLVGLGKDSSESSIQKKVQDTIIAESADIVGVDASSIARNLVKALGGSQ